MKIPHEAKKKPEKTKTIIVDRKLFWGAVCIVQFLIIVMLLIINQKQECVSETSKQTVYCEVDRANWAADKRQIKALHVNWNECERKLTDINKELKELTEKYNEAALEKKGNVTLLGARDKEEIKDLEAIQSYQEKLQDCNILVGGLKNSELKLENDVNRLEKKNKELKKKIAKYEELITAQSKAQKQKNQHSHDEV